MGFRRMLPHVKPKNKSGWLRYRRRFPKELVEVLGKKAHVKDLGTRSYEEAEPLAQKENGVWLRLVQGAKLNAGTSRNERLKVLSDLKSYGLVPPEAEDIDPFLITELRERVSEALDAVVKDNFKSVIITNEKKFKFANANENVACLQEERRSSKNLKEDDLPEDFLSGLITLY